MTKYEKKPQLVDREAKANWKLLLHVALDEYHVVAVHPDTFGKTGYLSNERIRYYRYGRHNCYFAGTDGVTFAQAAKSAANGKYRPRDYRIFQLFRISPCRTSASARPGIS